jgi:ubiquinone/menaquinone biosynthesis C-methylase UbiE
MRRTSWSESWYWKTRAFLVPQLEHSQVVYANHLSAALVGVRRWLDVGCGRGVMPSWLAGRMSPPDLTGRIAVGLDRDRSALAVQRHLTLRVAGDAHELPFEDGTFDLVSANMVLEHIEQPERLFAAVARVLRPGGRFLVHTPNARGYTTRLTKLIPRRLRPRLAFLLHGRPPEDMHPTYYRANEGSTLGRLAESAGLKLERLEFLQTSPQLLVFAPLMLVEMLVIRALAGKRLSRFRACLLVDLRKPAAAATSR